MTTESTGSESGSKLGRRIAERLALGRERYGHGVIVPGNATKNWTSELVEELLDACVYAAADVLTKRGVENDDDNASILDLIKSRETGTYVYGEENDAQLLDLCMFVTCAVLEKNM